ncbi:MAG: hypothetical protein F9B45_09230 [Phycisphaera sp. RhM]|nr:hypothetical protein [Phycisphaera sp. RhM]
MFAERRQLQNDESQRGVGALIAVISLAVGWVLGILSVQPGDENHQDGSKTLSGYIEPLQDPRERELIRKLEIGDDLSTNVDLRMLADEVISPGHKHFQMIYDFYATDHLNLPEDGGECEILFFDLRTQEYEGVRDYYIITRDCEVLAVCEGESVTI